jgi:hypothetical protein
MTGMAADEDARVLNFFTFPKYCSFEHLARVKSMT